VHEPGLTLRRGHVDAVSAVDGRANGLVVGNEHIAADLVVDASGRSGRVTSRLRGPAAVGGTCGIAYVDRQYQLLAGAEPGPMSNPLAWQGDFDGYQVILFRHEQGIFSVLVIRPTRYKDLVGLRHNAGFDAACQAIPVLAEWTDRARCQPLTDVLPGGELKNYYRSQRGPDGRLALPGLVFVGDAVCTTTPTFGRGVATSLMQAAELLRLVDEHGTDVVAVATELDDWCETNMRPWVEDHIRMDEDQRRRWEGGDVELDHRLPSNLIMVAAERDPTIAAGIGPYASMRAGPASLDAVEAKARAVYATGWRPPFADGPTKAELSQAVARTLR
jgi:2-polyprenyl-6-methoxyphenol hydroxylase-like FAD-dependent oxidoreductase